MKKVFLVLALIALFTIPALAQFDAGFLDSGTGVDNPQAWDGSAWYCLSHTYMWNPVTHQWYVSSSHIELGPFETYPNCNAG